MADTNTQKIDQIAGTEVQLEKTLEQSGLESISASPEAQFESTVAEALSTVTETAQTAKSDVQDYVQYAQSQDIFPEEFNEINKLNLEFGTTIDSWSQDFNKTIDEVKADNLDPSIAASAGVEPSLKDPTLGVTAESLRARENIPAEAPAAEVAIPPAAENQPVESPAIYDLAPIPEKSKEASAEPEPIKIDIPDMVPEEPAQPTGYTQDDLEDLAAAVRAYEQANPKRFKYKEWTMFSMIPSFMRKKDAWSHKLEIAYSTSKAKKWAEKILTAKPGIEFSRAKTALQRLDDHRIEASQQLLKQIAERLKPRYEKRKKLEAKAQFEADEIEKYTAQVENYRGAVEQWGKYPDIMAQIRAEIQPRINAINKRKERLGAIRLKAMPLLKEIAEMEAQKKKYETFTGPDRFNDIFSKLRKGPEKSS